MREWEESGEIAYLAGELSQSQRWFSQGKAHPLYSGCADPCHFPKYGKPNCIVCSMHVFMLSPEKHNNNKESEEILGYLIPKSKPDIP